LVAQTKTAMVFTMAVFVDILFAAIL